MHHGPAKAGGASAISYDSKVIPHNPGLSGLGAQRRKKMQSRVAAPRLRHLGVFNPWEGHFRTGQDVAMPVAVGGSPKNGSRSGNASSVYAAGTAVKGNLVGK